MNDRNKTNIFMSSKAVKSPFKLHKIVYELHFNKLYQYTKNKIRFEDLDCYSSTKVISILLINKLIKSLFY
jgi:hypothetical protein